MRIFSYEAAVEGNEAWLDELVANGVNLNEAHWVHRNRAVLHVVAAEGNEHAVELLVRKGADIELRDGTGFTPLHVAAQEGHANVLQKLVELGADVHARMEPHGDTALHLVSEFCKDPASSLAMVRTLLSHGAGSHLLLGGGDGDTPLHLAAFNGNHSVLQVLLQALDLASTGVDLQNTQGRTPLHYAAGKGNMEAVLLLMDCRASKYVRDAHGATPFHFAARCGHTNALEVLQLEDLDDLTTNHITALHYAAWNGRNEAVTWLLARGASTDIPDTLQGDTPLHLAARKGSALVVDNLITKGANALMTNKEGKLALGLADEEEHQDAAKAIVRAIRMSGEERIKDSLWTKDNGNGATLLHYSAAYGTAEDLNWILAIIKNQTSSNVHNNVNTQDTLGRNAVHWAAMKGNRGAASILARNNAAMNADSHPHLDKTPLSFAIINGEMDFAEELLQCRPKPSHGEDWLKGINSWMSDYYHDHAPKRNANFHGKIYKSLSDGFDKHTKPSIYPPNHFKNLFFEIPAIYLALHVEREDIASFIQRHSRGVEDAVNARGEDTGRTALHWATLLQKRKIVAQLCRTEVFSRELTANVEDKLGKTALQYAKEMGLGDIEKELMERSDVNAYVDGMYKDRQVYVDAANAILVGAALIAGVTFAGWLQPPLGYTNYYDLPPLPVPPAQENTFQSYAAIKQHVGVRVFWVFNSLSFFFAIATVIAGLVAVVPIPGVYIATTVVHLRQCLRVGSGLLGLSIVFVLGAFAAAGFTVLPPIYIFEANMMATAIAGGSTCLILLLWFARQLWSLRPEWLRAAEALVSSKLFAARTMPPSPPSARTMPPSPPSAASSPRQFAQEEPPKLYSVGSRYAYVPWDDGLHSRAP